MAPFIVYALPRSRTFWLSRYLSYGDWVCGHDEARHARSLDDVKGWFSQPNIGTVETAGAPWWRLVQKYQPDIRTVVVRRAVPDVVSSLSRYGFDPVIMTPLMTGLDRKLDQIERRVPNVLSVAFDDLGSERTCARVFEFCLPHQHDPAWFAIMAPLNLQINLAAMVRYARAYQPQFEKLIKVAKQRSIASMRVSMLSSHDGMVIQSEPFETFLQDGVPLFERHLVEVGEAPDAWRDKNLPLMRVLDGMGAMQVTTARCNGRMFGYLMTVISPSLEAVDVNTATHLTFFASPDAPGLGMKLQRAAIEALRERGVDELYLRAGVRGDGPRMGSLYRRLGAEDFGQMFKLDLKAAA